MRDIWILSDTHFGHTNIIKYCNRPFSNSKEMDEAMIEGWNSKVKQGDIVYHLGDVYMGLERDAIGNIMRTLNGSKRLVLGNHDNGKDQVLHNWFQKIMMWRMFPEFGLLLTHVPVHQSSLKIFTAEEYNKEGDCGPVQKSFLNIHGHIHQNPSPEGPYRCVCVEQTNYAPIHIEELRIK